MPSPRLLTLGGVLAAAFLAGSSSAPAAVTIGAPLDLPANVAAGCEISPSGLGFVVPPAVFTGSSTCTWLGADRISNATWTSQAPRGQWVIVRVRVRAGNRVGPMAATVLGNLRSQVGAAGSTICCRAMSESAAFTPAPNQVTQINTRLPVGNTVSVVTGEPVETVDYLAITVLGSAASLPVHDTGSGYLDPFSVRSSAWWPGIRLNQEQPLNSGFGGMFPLIQADLEPDADGDGFGDETQDSCATDATIRTRPVATAAQCRPPAPVAGGGTTPAPPGSFIADPAGARDTVLVAGSRTTAIPIICPAGAPAACTGTVGARTVQRLSTRTATTAATAHLRLAAKPFSVAPGTIGKVALTLPTGARRELARRGRLALNVTVTQTAPTAATATHRITVRRVAKTVRATRSGRVTVRVEDLANADATKNVTYDLRSGARLLAKVFTTPRPGRVRSVTFRLDADARAAVRRARRLSARVAASYYDAASNPIGASRPITVLAPR